MFIFLCPSVPQVMVPLTSHGADGTSEVPEHVDLVGEASATSMLWVPWAAASLSMLLIRCLGSALWSLSGQGQV